MKIFSLIFPAFLGLYVGMDAKCTAETRSVSLPIETRIADNPVAPDRQAYTDVRGSKVSLVKPQGFTNSDTFPGFQQESSKASIVVTELPGAYGLIAPGFTAANLKTRGMTEIGRQNMTIDGNPGLLLQVTQVANSVTFIKWIAIFGDDREAVSVVATFPKDTAPTLARSLKNSVTSAKWLRTKVVDPFADLKFAVTTSPSLKFAQRIQNALLYNKDGIVQATSIEDPLLVIAPSISNVAVGDPQQFAQKRLSQIQQVKNIQIVSGKPFKTGGLSGYEIIATATDAANNQPISVYQVMLFEGRSYYIIQGLVGDRLKAKYLPEFQQIAISFRKK